MLNSRQLTETSAHPPRRVATAILRAWPLPADDTARAIYRTSLRGLAADLLRVTARLAGLSAGTPHPDLFAALVIPSANHLRFTSDAWARISLRVLLRGGFAGKRPTCRVPLQVRICQPEGGGALVLEWRSPKRAGRPRPCPEHGATAAPTGPCTLALVLPPGLWTARACRRRATRSRPRARRARQPRAVRVHTRSRGDDILPMVRLSGAWLRRLGFAPHSPFTIAARRGRIVLTLADR